MSAWVLEIDGQPRLYSARISHMLAVMRAERVVSIFPVVVGDSIAWSGLTEDGQSVTLRPQTLHTTEGMYGIRPRPPMSAEQAEQARRQQEDIHPPLGGCGRCGEPPSDPCGWKWPVHCGTHGDEAHRREHDRWDTVK